MTEADDIEIHERLAALPRSTATSHAGKQLVTGEGTALEAASGLRRSVHKADGTHRCHGPGRCECGTRKVGNAAIAWTCEATSKAEETGIVGRRTQKNNPLIRFVKDDLEDTDFAKNGGLLSPEQDELQSKRRKPISNREQIGCPMSKRPLTPKNTTPPSPPAAPSPKVSARKLTPEEQDIIDYLERSNGRKLTPEEINLSLRQAREIGQL
jgi:hypothetical protein